MEESNEDPRVIPELYFLIAKFLSGGPLKETAETLRKELERVDVLPRRLDWLGNQHARSYQDLCTEYSSLPWDRLLSICSRAISLSRSHLPSLNDLSRSIKLSLLSESIVRPLSSTVKKDHNLVRRLLSRESGTRVSVFPPHLLSSLQLQRRTLGHLSAVYCLCFDSTNRYVVTGADDMLIKVWSARTGRLICTLRGAGAEITDVSISPDGALVAGGSVERRVRVWRITGEPVAVLSAHQGTITSVQWAPPSFPDVRMLASTSTDGSVAFWCADPRGQFLSQPVQYIERMRPGACHMICSAWSAGGGFLATGSADQRVRVYRVQAGVPRRVLEQAVHSEAVDSVSWARRGLKLVSGSKDGTAAIWTMAATQWRHVLLDISGEGKLKVTMVCWSGCDTLVVTAVSDKTIRVWCATTARQVRVLKGHTDEVYVLEPHPSLSNVFLSCGHDAQLFVWQCDEEQPIASFHNSVPGLGDGALFDAKWGPHSTIGACDAHGHLLLLGKGAGHPLFKAMPTELFFHSDYRPLVRSPGGSALDAETGLPPHGGPQLLVDAEGAPHPPTEQVHVWGGNRLQEILEALDDTNDLDLDPNSWEEEEPMRHCTQESMEMYAYEQEWYNREMRRRPVMISTAPPGEARRRPGRRRGGAGERRPPRPKPRPIEEEEIEIEIEEPEEEVSAWSEESLEIERERRPRRERERDSHSDTSELSLSLSDTNTEKSSMSSEYSDWEAGAALAPPVRARRTRRKPAPKPPPSPPPEPQPSCSTSIAQPVPTVPTLGSTSVPTVGSSSVPTVPTVGSSGGDWLGAVTPRKAPYQPQMGDTCVYFRAGHQRYFEAVSEKDVYKVHVKDKPWECTQVYECELVKVVGIKYIFRNGLVICSLRVSCLTGESNRHFTVKYHDMPDVIDFLILKQHFDVAGTRHWSAGDRFRCMIDDSWWLGTVVEVSASYPTSGPPDPGQWAPEQWAHSHGPLFLSVRVQWDNTEMERLSPWDLDLPRADRVPVHQGGSVPVLPSELAAVLEPLEPEWGEACRDIAGHVAQVMGLSCAEPFLAPVDLQLYPHYAAVVAYPIDLATIKARFDNKFYRRAAAAQFDVRYLALNAELFNEEHSPIVRAARLVTDLLLAIISEWWCIDVVSKYHELAANYHSSDDEPLANARNKNKRSSPRSPLKQRMNSTWLVNCRAALHEILASADSQPFRQPVDDAMEPGYKTVVTRPMDLSKIQNRLESNRYHSVQSFVRDVRQVFINSRLYNTNHRSRIYAMTARLSALWEEVWSKYSEVARAGNRTRHRRRLADTQPQPQPGVSNGISPHRDRDSLDSDTPLTLHRKGKGVGKKSKARRCSEDEPLIHHSTSRLHDEEYVPLPSDSSSSSERIPVLEEEIHSDVQLTYDEDCERHDERKYSRRRRRKRRTQSSSNSGSPQRKTRKRRRRSLAVSMSSSSSSSASLQLSGSGRDSDDDTPLHHLREQRDAEAGPSTSRTNGHSVSLRRRPVVQYSSRSPSPALRGRRAAHSDPARATRATRHHTRANLSAMMLNNDHNYFNGHAAPQQNAGGAGGSPPPPALSISSRGRVRKLTAKARGLFR